MCVDKGVLVGGFARPSAGTSALSADMIADRIGAELQQLLMKIHGVNNCTEATRAHSPRVIKNVYQILTHPGIHHAPDCMVRGIASNMSDL